MHNALYFTLAKSNLKKNRAIYLPYLLANVLIVSMYYILTSIRSMMQTYETTQGSNTDLIFGSAPWLPLSWPSSSCSMSIVL